jgi:uncharacterized membrane protein YedE/YeeE
VNAAAWLAGLTSLGVGLLAGFFMHRSDFCLAGAFRDLFLFRSVRRLRALLLAMAASALLFEAARLAGWLPYYPFPIFAPPSLANLVGGCLFGIGMVLAGGCVVGVLYKFGGGSLFAGVALLGLVVGSALYAEMHVWWNGVSRALALHDRAITLPQLTGTRPAWWAAGLALCGGWLYRRWRPADIRQALPAAEGYVPLPVTALILAVLGLLSALGTGMPLGITTAYAKIAAFVEEWFWPEHVATLAYFSQQSFRYALPGDGTLLSGGGGAELDVLALIQFPLIIGIILGALVSSLTLGEFQPWRRLPLRQGLMVFAGGVVMALGSRMTPGCNVWHLFGGLPLLTMESLLFLLGLLPGAWLGGRLLRRLVGA